jgi:hypothetical protein
MWLKTDGLPPCTDFFVTASSSNILKYLHDREGGGGEPGGAGAEEG